MTSSIGVGSLGLAMKDRLHTNNDPSETRRMVEKRSADVSRNPMILCDIPYQKNR